MKEEDQPVVQVEAQREESVPPSVVGEQVLKSIEKNFHRQPLAQRLEQVSPYCRL